MIDWRPLALLLLAGCGGSTPRAATPASTGVVVSRAPWSVAFANDAVLSYSGDGVLSIDGDELGRLEPDGYLVRDGDRVASIASSGALTVDGEELPLHVVGDRMMQGDAAVLEVTGDEMLHVRTPDGAEIAAFHVEGAAPEAHSTILFLSAFYLLEAREGDDDRAEEAHGEEPSVGTDEDEDLWNMPIDDAPAEGPPGALVTIVELTDFQCPYCSRGASVMTQIRARFPDDVRLVVRQRPLPFHENARPAAEAALEARAQQGDAGFFRMAALLFANQRALTRSTLESLAVTIGLDLPRFRRALDESAHEEAIARDEALGDQMAAEGTPTFYVNGELMVGAQPLSSFVHAVERARARAQTAIDGGAPRDRLYETMLAHGRTRSSSEAEELPPAPDVRFVDLAVPSDAPAIGTERRHVSVQIFVDLGSSYAGGLSALVDRLAADPVRATRVVLRLSPREGSAARTASEAVFAVRAASSAELAFRFAMELSRTPTDLSTAHLTELATRIAHVSPATLRAALDAHTHRARVDADRHALHAASLGAAPVVVLAGRRVVWGAPTFDVLAQAVDAAMANPDEGRPTAPPDVAHAPASAHTVSGGGAWMTEHPSEGPSATTTVLARIASWDESGIVLDGTSGPPVALRLSGLDAPLREALTGIQRGEIRRVWLPGPRVLYVEAVDVE